jgi:hypothetical protein
VISTFVVSISNKESALSIPNLFILNLSSYLQISYELSLQVYGYCKKTNKLCNHFLIVNIQQTSSAAMKFEHRTSHCETLNETPFKNLFVNRQTSQLIALYVVTKTHFTCCLFLFLNMKLSTFDNLSTGCYCHQRSFLNGQEINVTRSFFSLNQTFANANFYPSMGHFALRIGPI